MPEAGAPSRQAKDIRMKKPGIFALSLILILAAGTGCGKKDVEIDPNATSDQELFELGEQNIDKNPEKGRLYLRQVIDSFPRSPPRNTASSSLSFPTAPRRLTPNTRSPCPFSKKS
jgi:hypothetical protein